MESDVLSEAVVVWTGWRRKPYPLRQDAAVLERFGADEGRRLVPAVHRLADDFYSLDASRTVGDLVAMGEAAAAEFRARHPSVTDDAVAALTWCYTFDFK